MKVSFHAQPFRDFGGWTATWFRTSLSGPGVRRLQIATAWAKRSAFLRLREDIDLFRTRGGLTEAIIGIDHGGATLQGLKLALDVFDNAFIFHDPAGKTFHPKVYVISATDSASVLIGSNNLTAGGFYSNFEAATTIELTLANPDDRAFYNSVQEWLDLLRSDHAACLELTDALIDELCSDDRYKIQDEDVLIRQRGIATDDTDSAVEDSVGDSLFRRSELPLEPVAPRIPGIVKHDITDEALVEDSVGPAGIGAEHFPSIGAGPLHPVRSWCKQMSKADAQHPTGAKSNPTGNLKLTKAKHDIDKNTYFRHDMFGYANWEGVATESGTRERALVEFDTVIDGTRIGPIALMIDHQESRIAGQSNIPTWLHWGELMPHLRDTNYTGAWVIIQELSNGSHALTITWVDPN
jgi:hypothetical protein